MSGRVLVKVGLSTVKAQNDPTDTRWFQRDGIWHATKTTPHPLRQDGVVLTRCVLELAEGPAFDPREGDAICCGCNTGAHPVDLAAMESDGPWVLAGLPLARWHRVDEKVRGVLVCGLGQPQPGGTCRATAGKLPEGDAYEACRVCNGLPRHDWRTVQLIEAVLPNERGMSMTAKHLYLDGKHRACAGLHPASPPGCGHCVERATKLMFEIGREHFQKEVPEDLFDLVAEPLMKGEALNKALVEGLPEESVTKPSYYRRTYHSCGTVHDVFDIVEAHDLPYHLGDAIAYLVRAGKKTDDAVPDMRKAIRHIEREIEQRERAKK